MTVVPMVVTDTEISGLIVIRLKQVDDERGVVREFYRESEWREAGLPSLGPWLQTNVTESKRGALRGLHGERMNKLVGVVAGSAFGAYVDTRPGSTSVGKVVTMELTAGTAVLVPDGVCNGFQTTSELSQYLYCFDAEWAPGMAGPSIDALDPALAIVWPLPIDRADPAQLSERDRSLPTLAEHLAD
jgi:dTDP-4-dehydrorhamnose 3,5-epimerase